MRLTFLSIFSMTVATLGSAVFFVQTMGDPARVQVPRLSGYAAAWGTALASEKPSAASRAPLDEVTIINAKPR